MQPNIALYVGSFDPITNGHLGMIEQAADLFDQLIVAVGVNPNKTGMFTVEERLAMIRQSTEHDNVSVIEFKGFTVKFAVSVGARYLIRGIRNATDYHAETEMHNLNYDIDPDVETIFLMPRRGMAEVSSSTIKGFVGPEGWEEIVQRYVPPAVLEKLKEKDRARQG